MSQESPPQTLQQLSDERDRIAAAAAAAVAATAAAALGRPAVVRPAVRLPPPAPLPEVAAAEIAFVFPLLADADAEGAPARESERPLAAGAAWDDDGPEMRPAGNTVAATGNPSRKRRAEGDDDEDEGTDEGEGEGRGRERDRGRGGRGHKGRGRGREPIQWEGNHEIAGEGNAGSVTEEEEDDNEEGLQAVLAAGAADAAIVVGSQDPMYHGPSSSSSSGAADAVIMVGSRDPKYHGPYGPSSSSSSASAAPDARAPSAPAAAPAAAARARPDPRNLPVYNFPRDKIAAPAGESPAERRVRRAPTHSAQKDYRADLIAHFALQARAIRKAKAAAVRGGLKSAPLPISSSSSSSAPTVAPAQSSVPLWYSDATYDDNGLLKCGEDNSYRGVPAPLSVNVDSNELTYWKTLCDSAWIAALTQPTNSGQNNKWAPKIDFEDGWVDQPIGRNDTEAVETLTFKFGAACNGMPVGKWVVFRGVLRDYEAAANVAALGGAARYASDSYSGKTSWDIKKAEKEASWVMMRTVVAGSRLLCGMPEWQADGTLSVSLPVEFGRDTKGLLVEHERVATVAIATMLTPDWHGQERFKTLFNIWAASRMSKKTIAAKAEQVRANDAKRSSKRHRS